MVSADGYNQQQSTPYSLFFRLSSRLFSLSFPLSCLPWLLFDEIMEYGLVSSFDLRWYFPRVAARASDCRFAFFYGLFWALHRDGRFQSFVKGGHGPAVPKDKEGMHGLGLGIIRD